jgi:L-malate glycosyltransferase
VLPAYREPLFEALRNQAYYESVELELWHSLPEAVFARRGTTGHLPWATRVTVWTLPRWLGGVEWQRLPWFDVISADVMIVSDNVRVLSNAAAIILRRLVGKPVLTWGHGVNFQPNSASRRFARLRGWLLRLADRNLVYTATCVAPMLALGFYEDRITVTENAIDTTEAAGLHPSHPEVNEFRSRHGLGEAPCIAFLGSWYARKRPELILEIGKAIRLKVNDARVLVIGGGDGLANLGSLNLPWLTLLGPLSGRDKFVALSAARCLAVTGVAGLNLLDAMAVGLPVVAPLRDDHSPEIAYVQTDVNGLVVPDDLACLADACIQLCSEDRFHQRLSLAAKNTADKLTVDRMAANMLNAVMSKQMTTT